MTPASPIADFDFAEAVNRFATLSVHLPETKREHIAAMLSPLCDEIVHESNKLDMSGLNRSDYNRVKQVTDRSSDAFFEALATSPYRGFLAVNFIIPTGRGKFEDQQGFIRMLQRLTELTDRD